MVGGEGLRRELLEFEYDQEVRSIINGQPVMGGGAEILSRESCNHKKIVARTRMITAEQAKEAVEAALAAKEGWESLPPLARAEVFWRAAQLLKERRAKIVATTMKEVGKTPLEADADFAEMIDFLNFNPYWALKFVYPLQPEAAPGETNIATWRALRGFVLAITPWNFPLAIGTNLPTAPAIMGNTVVWKPSSDALAISYRVMEALLDAGLPPGVINLVYGAGSVVGEELLKHPQLGGIHFTGSLAVGRRLYQVGAGNLENGFIRIVAECGGKDFLFALPDADLDSLAWAIVAGAYGYQGQKCSACSRSYIPESIWPEVKGRLIGRLKKMKVGDVSDLDRDVEMGAVVNEAAWEKIRKYVEQARESDSCEILYEREADRSVGYYIGPVLVRVSDHDHPLIQEEVFGPVHAVWVYPDNGLDEALGLCRSSGYALTGSIYGTDAARITYVHRRLLHAAGNIYINDKCTGAIVNRQWFGGDGWSGTNDKAGSPFHLLRWVSPAVTKWVSHHRTD
ncbi:MAG: aldehyde dehydrogenase family protein [Candidatus Bipolaricaulia bacterium]